MHVLVLRVYCMFSLILERFLMFLFLLFVMFYILCHSVVDRVHMHVAVRILCFGHLFVCLYNALYFV